MWAGAQDSRCSLAARSSRCHLAGIVVCFFRVFFFAFLFVFTANTHYRLATAWHPFRRVAAR
ncbi:hypothetical protein CORC01_07737 [Colletotrichum orchidophilum]|uniref:Uncharacterized protein n=1 Tax=Colletotrichum orchidophilum TaxID=1209926 RepID=A0A1G4B6M5_9PEZI|nr:uncharacterized protein CORC01_07737 [Colletotrichum orchidophilum]OHE96952.1 hypothetical protein CORC01_07737 [Colletotrichum orchidophilum]